MTPSPATVENLRAPGAIVLVSCYELGHTPHGLAVPRAFLERAGYRPRSLDLAIETLDEDSISRARVVAVSVPMHTALRIGTQVTTRIRRLNPECRVIFHGLYASLNSRYLLDHGVDYCLGGEIEEPLVALMEALEAGHDRASLPGVAHADHASGPHLERLDFPVPSRDDGLHGGHARLESDGAQLPAGYTEASRGCRHGCTHCPIPPVYGGRFFVIPADVVIEDIRHQVEAGARHITFGDPDFLNGPRHALKVARALHQEFPGLTFDFTAKVEHLIRRQSDLPELADCGALFVISAVESLSPSVLEILDKNHTRGDVEKALSVTRAAGIVMRPTWLPFTPWTTLEDFQEILEFVEAEEIIACVDPIQLAIRLLVPPGSWLAEHPSLAPHRGRLNEAAFTYEWTHPDPAMDRLQKDLLRLVEEDTRNGVDPRETFASMCIHSDRPELAARVRATTPGPRPPRLTESWFC